MGYEWVKCTYCEECDRIEKSKFPELGEFYCSDCVKWFDLEDGTSKVSPSPASSIVEGVGKEAPTVVNAQGGKQSHCPYRMDLLPPLAALAVSKVLAEGAKKYGELNWHKIEVKDNLNHMLTHCYAYLAGDKSDEHLEHMACRALMALELALMGKTNTNSTGDGK